MESDKSNILIVDDEEDLCEILQFNLNNSGFNTDVAHSSEETLKKPLENYDLFLLDVMMGNMSGFRLAEKLKKEYRISVPIIFLTAKDTENDILTGFSVGADDYMAKPFSINELIARVKAVLKRSGTKHSGNTNKLNVSNIEIDDARKQVMIEKKKINLTKKEFEIFKLLLENRGTVFSREDILRRIWGGDIIVTERTVDVNIARIRNKIGIHGPNLKNKSGFGYFFEF